MEINPELLSLGKLLEHSIFTIPNYQRPYSWKGKEREDLFGDLGKVFDKDQSEFHFMATIVCLRKKTAYGDINHYYCREVVDGQQRLTTIILILNAIKLELEDSDETHAEIKTELCKYLFRSDIDELILLQTNHDDNHFFDDYIRSDEIASYDKAASLSDKNLIDAMHECKKFVEHFKGEKLIRLYSCLKNQLKFVLYETQDEKSVYSVFEILNSRGMSVAWLARLKTALMGKAFDLPKNDSLIMNLHGKWSAIYKQIGIRTGLDTEVLRIAAILYSAEAPSKQLSEEESVQLFDQLAIGSSNSMRKIAEWIRKVAETCVGIRSKNRHIAVTRVLQSRLLAVSIQLSSFTETEKKVLMELCEKVTFRIYGMLPTDARREVGEFRRLAWEIVNSNGISSKHVQQRLKAIVEKYPMEEAIKHLRRADCYNDWTEELRYFLMRYEEHLTKEAGYKLSNPQWIAIWEASSVKDSVEHIFPQSYNSKKSIMHNIGNLMLLPPTLNSQLQDKSPKRKFKKYLETGLFHAAEVADKENWTNQHVYARQRKLLNWAKKEWAI